MLRYLAHTTLCDLAFVVFLVSWFVTRHVLFVLVIMSLYTDAPKYIPRIWDPANGYYMTFNCWVGFVASLCALQVRAHPYYFISMLAYASAYRSSN